MKNFFFYLSLFYSVFFSAGWELGDDMLDLTEKESLGTQTWVYNTETKIKEFWLKI